MTAPLYIPIDGVVRVPFEMKQFYDTYLLAVEPPNNDLKYREQIPSLHLWDLVLFRQKLYKI